MARGVQLNVLCLALLWCASTVTVRAARIKRQEADQCVEPSAPVNGQVECNNDYFYLTCTITCSPGYEFADNSTSLEFQCDIYSFTWLEEPVTPPCVPICTNPCLNGGTCSGPDHCDCAQGYRGDQCQQNQCVEPSAPVNGQVECNNDFFYMTCTITCSPGYEFADKSTPLEFQCDILSFTWLEEPVTPPCVPICTNPCLNGGTCSGPDHCDCAQGYRGDECQQRSDLCVAPNNPDLGTE